MKDRSKDGSPGIVVQELGNGMLAYFVPLRGRVYVPAEAFSDQAQLHLVENPSDALKQSKPRIGSNLDPRDVAQRTSNPRAGLVQE